MNKGWHWDTIHMNAAEMVPVPVIWDAVIATQALADGRMIPVLIVDTTSRPYIDDMIRAHKLIGPGDVHSVWAKVSRWDNTRIRLLLVFDKPSHCGVILEFDVAAQGYLVDCIVRAQGLYLQGGRPGDRLASNNGR